MTTGVNRLTMAVLLLGALLAGCGDRIPAVAGGTTGKLRSGEAAFSEIQITVHRVDQGSTTVVGFGDVLADGQFELVIPGAAAPLQLEPGEYRFTLESIGAPVTIPREFTTAESTPLKMTWTGEEPEIDLDIPALKPR